MARGPLAEARSWLEAALARSEHVAIPDEVGKRRGHRYYDPLATFGYMAALTKRDQVTARARSTSATSD